MASAMKMREYIEITGTEKRLGELFSLMVEQTMKKNETSFPEDIEAHIRRFIKSEIIPIIVEAVTKFVGSSMTDNEIDEIVKFHLSPVGQKLNDILIPGIQQIGMDLDPVLTKKTEEFINELESTDNWME